MKLKRYDVSDDNYRSGYIENGKLAEVLEQEWDESLQERPK